MFRRLVEEPWPSSRGNVWMPTSPTRNPLSLVLIAISAPMKGLDERSSSFGGHLLPDEAQAAAEREDQVVVVAQAPEFAQVVHLVLVVPVGEGDPLLPRGLEAGPQGPAVSQVLPVVDDPHPRAPAGELVGDLAGPVGRAVVDDDDLVVGRQLCKDAMRLRRDALDRPLVPVDREEEADPVGGGGVHGVTMPKSTSGRTPRTGGRSRPLRLGGISTPYFPAVPAMFSVLAAAAANAGVATLLLLAFSLFGFALLAARLRPKSSAIAVPVSLSVGSAAIGWSSWIVGSLVGTWALAPLWIGCALFSLTSLRTWGMALGRVSRHLLALARATPLLTAFVLAAAAPLLLFSLAIPLVDNDGIRSHVALPKLYLLTGRIFLYAWDVTGAYPALGDALYLVGLVVKSHDTATFLHAGHLASALAVLALTLHRDRRSRSAALAGPLGVVWQTPDSGEDDETAGIHNFAGLLLFFFGLRERLVRLAACMALPFLVYAAFTSPPTRYLLPMLWGLSLAAAAMLARLVPRRGAWLAIPLALPGLFVSRDFQARNFGAADYLFGHSSREEYLGRTIPDYRAAAYVNGLAPGCVMVGDIPGPVYFNRPWIVEGLINEAPLTIWIRNGEDADRLLARLHENGIRWLLARPAFGGGTPLSLLTYSPDPSKDHVMAALRSRLRFVKTVDGVDVWEVPASAAPAKP